jgi:PAS domain S-box-containing protein
MDSVATIEAGLSDGALRQILDNTTAVVYVKDRDGRFRFVNRHFLRVFGLQASEVIGRRDADLFPPEIAVVYRENDLRVLESGAAKRFEESAQESDGRHSYLSHKFPLFDAEGEPYAVCGISTDISEVKRAEELLCNVALGVAGAVGDGVFDAIVRYLAATLDVDFAFVGELAPGPQRLIRSLAVCMDGRISEALEYDPGETPCRDVVGRGFSYVGEDVLARYPTDGMLRQCGFTGYAGYPLTAGDGSPLGVIAVLSRRRLPEKTRVEAVLKIFAARAAAELERLRADAIREQSELSYRAIFDASEDCIFVHDLDSGAIVDVNPRACRAYGYTREEFLRLGPGDLGSGVPPYTLEGAASWIEEAKHGIPVRVEWHRRNKDGSLHWDEVVLKRATIGGVERVLAFTREITERKAREEALRKSEDRLRAMVVAALDCIIGMDADGRIVEFNPAAEACFGHCRDDALGRPLAELIIPERHRQAHQRGLAHHLATGEGPYLGQRVEVTALRASGEEFPAELAIDVAQGADGPIYIGYLRDISPRREAEAERARLEAQLRQAQKMEAIGQLAGGIAHDFNNMLTTIMGYVALVLEKLEERGDARLAGFLDNAHRSGLRARDLIQQLLTFSRGQRGEPRPLALAPHIADAVKLLAASLPASVELEADLDAAVPRIMLDPVQLEQILMNLCINARDAMAGRGRLRITLSQRERRGAVCASCRQPVSGRHVELAVVDEGPGIAPEVAERMFEPFYSTKEVGKGSGMGLAMVHGIVHEHGGHVIVEHGPAGGTAFRVLFRPLASGSRQAAESGASDEPLRPAGARLSGRVLLVDDEAAVGDFMRDLLQEWGLRVTLFEDPVAARDHFARDPRGCDLVVLDQTMPRLTGLELAQDMLLLRPDLPVILYSGYREALSEAQTRAIGIRALVKKPVDVAALHKLLAELLVPSVAS